MFIPNQHGTLEKMVGYDVNAEKAYGVPIECPYGVVNMVIGAQKTSVRADSSASRGAADEIATTRSTILVPPYVGVSLNDRFISREGYKFIVNMIHPRYSVSGVLDHIEVGLEVTP